jgi:hypothetical protein
MSNKAIVNMTNKLIEIEKSNPIAFAYIQGRVDSLVEKHIDKEKKKENKKLITIE